MTTPPWARLGARLHTAAASPHISRAEMYVAKVKDDMNIYVVLLRGINVGGKNIIPMAGLKECLVELGFANVSTYIASGNVMLASDRSAAEIQSRIESALVKSFELGGSRSLQVRWSPPMSARCTTCAT